MTTGETVEGTGMKAGRPPAGGSRRPWQLLSLVLAVVVAVLAVLALRSAGAEETEPVVEESEVVEPSALTGTPEANAVLACEIMTEVDPAGFEDYTSDEAWADLTRANAAASLGHVAETLDPSYQELRELLGAPGRVYATTYLMAEEYTEAVVAAQAACEDVLDSRE